ncbi:Ankyrin repeat domain-containing protein 2 [Tetrabaena socialis]|uniref:Ankyrin repeat domain-containing protein 2 n=1 Tax=Tetrabaena socialis TaxID=47790 RepID=A0A2J8ABE5_9CHLO|nr:Ankyrin repeat domain-containing protein 2 [Tetrabaena socialis]|eukprot:PNH09850.1 Ankyrin repeat domain-containing protein 2 [Tetrabaena socialis]
MLSQQVRMGLGRRPAPFTPARGVAAPRSVRVANSQQEMMAKAMQDPNFQKQMAQMQEMMKKPEMQQQMAEMQAVMQNQQLQQRMQALKEDPEFAEYFKEIQKGGMQALMKYYNDPAFLEKLGEKIGDVVPKGGGGPAAAMAPPPGAMMPPGAAPPAPEINNIRDAAKHGDEEAVEDFLAIGKNPDEPDTQGRTALHYAAATDRPIIAKMLIDEGASLEVRDSMSNTPLHYACGYGRAGLARMLLDAGADRAAKNGTGKRPVDLAT